MPPCISSGRVWACFHRGTKGNKSEGMTRSRLKLVAERGFFTRTGISLGLKGRLSLLSSKLTGHDGAETHKEAKAHRESEKF